MKKKCKHKWKEDELMASGAVTLITGSPTDLKKETRVQCTKCKKVKYIEVEDLGSITDL